MSAKRGQLHRHFVGWVKRSVPTVCHRPRPGLSWVGMAPKAERTAEFYDALAWVAYAFMFLVIPFFIIVFRGHMAPVDYCIPGAFFLGFLVMFYWMDAAATRIREREAHPA